MRLRYFFSLILFLCSQTSSARTVIYTTAQHPVSTVEPGVQVVRLDEAQRLEQFLFPRLSDDPEQAEQQARRWLPPGSRVSPKPRQ
jgi:integrating conjugative element protein (TIGR03757 family)